MTDSELTDLGLVDSELTDFEPTAADFDLALTPELRLGRKPSLTESLGLR